MRLCSKSADFSFCVEENGGKVQTVSRTETTAYAANITLGFCRQDANTKLAKESDWW